jgi:DNA end-binding protein Ku
MRAIWTGSISFGLVNIPVKMYSGAKSSHGLDLHMLHRSDHSPVRFARVCRKDGKEISWNDIIKGYEYEDGDYIELTNEDFEKADKKETHALDIQQFVDREEIDVRYFEKPYYLEPDKKADKAYELLHRALSESNKLALVKYVIRQREHLGVIMPVGRSLVLDQMRFPHDIRQGGDLKLPKGDEVTKAEVEMGKELIKNQTKPFVPEDYHDTYTEKLESIIAAKAKGKRPQSKGKEPPKTETKDLMEALKASLAGANK